MNYYFDTEGPFGLFPPQAYPKIFEVTYDEKGKIILDMSMFPEDSSTIEEFLNSISMEDIIVFRMPTCTPGASYNDAGFTQGEFYVQKNSSQLLKYISGNSEEGYTTLPSETLSGEQIDLDDWRARQPMLKCKLVEEPFLDGLSQYSIKLIQVD